MTLECSKDTHFLVAVGEARNAMWLKFISELMNHEKPIWQEHM